MNEDPTFVPETEAKHDRPLVPKALSNPNCPIQTERVELFVDYWKKNGFSNELIAKLLNNLRFIDKESFSEALTYLAEQIETFSAGGDYYIFIAQWNKSESFILDAILPLLKRKPKGFITHESLRKGVTVDGAILEKVPPKSKIIHLNDWALTGNQDSLRIKEASEKLEEPNWASFLVEVTNQAKEHLEKDEKVQVTSFFLIPTNDEVYTPDEIETLEAISTTDQFKSYSKGVQTFSYFKVPDNFPTFMRGSKTIKYSKTKDYPWLINDWIGGIYPSYNDITYKKIIKRAKQRKKPLLRYVLAPF